MWASTPVLALESAPASPSLHLQQQAQPVSQDLSNEYHPKPTHFSSTKMSQKPTHFSSTKMSQKHIHFSSTKMSQKHTLFSSTKMCQRHTLFASPKMSQKCTFFLINLNESAHPYFAEEQEKAIFQRLIV